MFESEFISEGYYPGRIYRVDIYPGVVFDPDNPTRVKGEVHLLSTPDKTLQELDRYENAKPLVALNPDYERVLRPIETFNGTIECWVYEYIKPVNPATELQEGDIYSLTFI